METVEINKPEPTQPQPTQGIGSQQSFINTKFLNAFKLKQHWTAAPTYTPNNFFDQIVFYDDGVNFRVYLYINGTWRYVALT